MSAQESIQAEYVDTELATAQKQYTQKMLVRILTVAQLLIEATHKDSISEEKKTGKAARIVEKTQY